MSAAAVTADRGLVAGIAVTSAALLMTELVLTRIFSVTMFYHFAFLAISIALLGLSASGVFVYVARRRLASRPTRELLWKGALLHAAATLLAVGCLVRIRVELDYSAENLGSMLAIYLLAALPFFTGGAVISLAFSRLTGLINVLYASDLAGAAAGCLVLVPLLNFAGATGAVFTTALLSCAAALCFAPVPARRRALEIGLGVLAIPAAAQLAGLQPFDITYAKGYTDYQVLFSKWNSFSRVAVHDRPHHDWSLSPKFSGKRPASLFMDIDAGASTPILKGSGRIEDAAHLRYELTSVGYHLAERPGGFDALVIGPGGGRDVLTALLFGARRIDAVEINPIIVRDVMLGRFREYSGNLYGDPRVFPHVEDGRSYVRRSAERFDVIQASLVDTWAATAAGAYTLTENSLYTVEAFGDYLDHLTPAGMLTITRWMQDGLRLVVLAQEACAQRGLDASRHLAIVRHQNVATFILKRSPFSRAEVQRLQKVSEDLGFSLLYAPGIESAPAEAQAAPGAGTPAGDYRALITASNPAAFIAAYRADISPSTDDRPFYFHTTRLRDQLDIAAWRHGLFGHGLSALLMLFGISLSLVLLFIVGPLALGGEHPGQGWGTWLGYFGALGAGFMLIEVALLQHFVLLLGHPVYSLTVTLFALLLGTGLGSLVSRRMAVERVGRFTCLMLVAVALAAVAAAFALPRVIDFSIAWPLAARIAIAVAVLVPFGLLLGTALPGGMRLLDRARPQIVAWGWGINGAFSVIGATLAVFVAMNWGFAVTLMAGAAVYLAAAAVLAVRPAA